MQTIHSRKYLAATIVISLGFAAILAFSRQEDPFCRLPSMKAKPQSTSSNPGDKNMATTNTGNPVEHADESNFDRLVLQSSLPVLVDFHAQWCGPCKLLAPELEKIAAETPDIRVVKVDVDENQNLARQYQIESIPSVKVFRNGKITAELLGFASKAELKELLAR